jgi:hypothetical protein
MGLMHLALLGKDQVPIPSWIMKDEHHWLSLGIQIALNGLSLRGLKGSGLARLSLPI